MFNFKTQAHRIWIKTKTYTGTKIVERGSCEEWPCPKLACSSNDPSACKGPVCHLSRSTVAWVLDRLYNKLMSL